MPDELSLAGRDAGGGLAEEGILFDGALETHVNWAAVRLRKTASLAREMARRSAAAGNEYLYVDMKWMEGGAYLHLGRLAESSEILAEVIPRAERVGHHGAAWAARSLAALVPFFSGDLAGAGTAIALSRAYGEKYRVVWRFFDTQLLGFIALCRDEMAQATEYLTAARDRDGLPWRVRR